jgi:transposase
MSQQPILRGRRYISQSEKVRIVGESQTSGLSTAEVARINKVGLSSLIKWRKQYSEGGSVSVKSDDDVISKKEYLKLKKQYRNLETVLGRKSAENEVLKEAVVVAREKKLISESAWLSVKNLVED